ncbi:MAG: N-6 DNA methylase [Phycisphaerales bacterium]
MKPKNSSISTSLFENHLVDKASVSAKKATGAYYTPDAVVRSLVSWATRKTSDRMLDPACGDGRFLMAHPTSVGVEQDPLACQSVHSRAPGSLIHQGDFFAWAGQTHERFDCAAGNPPFIRYQRFAGEVREAALRLCQRHGAQFSSLASSWAPFLVATATLLKPGGRMAFVVPAEIGHAPYAAPVLEYMTKSFDRVQIIAVRDKLFPDLSEDCWMLYADGYGGHCDALRFTTLDHFTFAATPPRTGVTVTMAEWRKWNCRLRPFLLDTAAREMYTRATESGCAQRLGNVARVGIGYVTGANDFFHLRPSQAERLGITRRLLHPAVRNGKSLARGCVDEGRVTEWMTADDPVLLLRLPQDVDLPTPVRRYLDSEPGREARGTYKCRNRDPWYSVPDVTVPDGFLSYMSGAGPTLASNQAGCVCTNSVHAVHLAKGMSMARLMQLWAQPLTALSCELEGHPLGGGMLKIEPREAARIVLSDRAIRTEADKATFANAVTEMKRWRHYA